MAIARTRPLLKREKRPVKTNKAAVGLPEKFPTRRPSAVVPGDSGHALAPERTASFAHAVETFHHFEGGGGG